MFPASSPQAKGRVERLWRHYKAGLSLNFVLYGITTIEQANAFLPDYIKKYNKKFAVPAQDQKSAFIPLPEKTNLDTLLCVKIQRTTDNSGVFSINNCKFAVNSKDVPPKARITVLISKDAGIKALYKDKLYKVSDVDYLVSESSIQKGRILSLEIQTLIHEYYLKNAKAA